jgi:NAD-dependent dihydropyrimidine dehydrogenase PreA subunit
MSKAPTFWSSVAQHWQIARTLRQLKIHFDPAKCIGVWQCYQVCPVGCWTPNYQTRVAEFHDEQLCVACGACVLQCPAGAIELS